MGALAPPGSQVGGGGGGGGGSLPPLKSATPSFSKCISLRLGSYKPRNPTVILNIMHCLALFRPSLLPDCQTVHS